jgi:hypothetical protein
MKQGVLLGLLLLCLLPSAGFPATMPAVRMKVVDAQDDSPVAAAHVLFHAAAKEGTFTGHGGRHSTLFVVETVTDDSGELRLPKQEFSPRPFFLNTNYTNPHMIIFKPGYVLVYLLNNRRIIPELQDMTTWEYNAHTIKMKRATRDSETSQAVDLAASSARQTMGLPDLCAWKKIPRFLVAVDRAAADWNQKRASLADDFLRRHSASSPLHTVLMNEALYLEKGCGSPKAFFEPYLR